MSVFSIGVSGLTAAQLGLATTGHNIANANTDGFRRQSIVQTTQPPLQTGAGSLGQGALVTDISRAYNDFLERQMLEVDGQASYYQTLSTSLASIDNLLGDPQAGLAPAVQTVFSGVQQVAADPASVPARQVFLNSASALVGRLQAMDSRLSDLFNSTNGQIVDSVNQMNTYATQIANLNDSIRAVESTDGTKQANDLRDQRDQLVSDLNKIANVRVVVQGSDYNVYVGNGLPVVVGAYASKLGTQASADNPQNIDITIQQGATSILVSPNTLNGGQIGALQAFRDGPLALARNSLGRVATALGSAFNGQQQLGQDLQGNLGQALFAVGSPTVYSNSNNTGAGALSVTISNSANLTTSDYRLQFNAGVYTLTKQSDKTSTTLPGSFPGTPYTVDGITLSLAGVPANGDSFLIQPTVAGASGLKLLVSDPTLIAAAAPIATAASTSNTGTGSIDAGSVSSVANLPLPGTVTLTYNSGTSQFSVAGAVPAVAPFSYTSGSPISFNGLTFQISGVPANGDTFTVSPNTGGVSDGRNTTLLGALETAGTVENASTTLEGAYSQLVSQIGTSASGANINNQAQTALASSVHDSQQSYSGVNLDEEAANLIRYQQAYQAASKLIVVAQQMFSQLAAVIQ